MRHEVDKYYTEKINDKTDIEIQSQHFCTNRYLSMELISLELFQIVTKSGIVPKFEFHTYINTDN